MSQLRCQLHDYIINNLIIISYNYDDADEKYCFLRFRYRGLLDESC